MRASTPAHQFRTRNGLIESQQTRSIRNENAAKSTKPTIIPPLITVWLQVRVLPGSLSTLPVCRLLCSIAANRHAAPPSQFGIRATT
jgi:hypothetical protein